MNSTKNVAIRLSLDEARAVEETGIDPREDLTRVLRGLTVEELRVECLDGADEDRVGAWESYASTIGHAAETWRMAEPRGTRLVAVVRVAD